MASLDRRLAGLETAVVSPEGPRARPDHKAELDELYDRWTCAEPQSRQLQAYHLMNIHSWNQELHAPARRTTHRQVLAGIECFGRRGL